jgi:cytochrome c-type biogenesis protein
VRRLGEAGAVSAVGLVTNGPLVLATPVAAAAGLLSFLSPCVLPLVPGYLSFITGLSGEELEDRERHRASPAQIDADAAPTMPAMPAASSDASAAPVLAAAPAVLPAGSAATGLLVAPGRSDSPVPGTAGAGRVGPGAVGGDTPGGWARRWFGSMVRRLRRGGRVAAGTGLFVLGFTLVFVSYGAAFGGLGQWLSRHQVGVGQVLGAFTIVMGLTYAGLFSRMSWANREFRIHRLPRPGLLGAPVLGMLFGLGWTPCLGPTLSAVQGLAVTSATAGRGAFLSAVYCLGLGLPFLAVGLTFRRAVGALRLLRRHARILTLAGGVLLVAVGVLQLTGEWADLILTLRPHAPGFSETPL